MYGNKYSDQLLPLLTPEMLTRYPDQTCDILNKLIRLAQKSSTSAVSGGGEGNLEDIVQTTTSYADGGVNVVTAYLSDGTTQDFQIRNGHQGSQGEQGETGPKGDPGKGCPIGTILPFGGDLIPEGYLVCDGSAVSRTTYADLFDVIGTRYGAGDGSTTFNLPNLSGRVAVGQDLNDADFDTLGDNGGSKAHRHDFRIGLTQYYGAMVGDDLSNQGAWSYEQSRYSKMYGKGDQANIRRNNVGTGMTTYNESVRYSIGDTDLSSSLQPYLVTKYIIKWKDLPATVAEVKDSYSSSSTDVYSASYINNALNNTNDILNLIYPVGSIYMSTNNVSPANFIGGQWERIQDKFLLSAGSTYAAGTSGGNATHRHSLSDAGFAKCAGISGVWKWHEIKVPSYNITWQLSGSAGRASGNSTYGTGLGGNTDDTTNLPPYLAVYVWKRTA